MKRLYQSHFLWLAALLLATIIIYWPGLHGGYAFDDYPNIVLNEPLHVTSLRWSAWVSAVFSSMSSELQRPLSMLTFAVNCYFTGLDPMPMKLTNIGIHLLNALLVFGLLRTLLRASCRRAQSNVNTDTAALVATSFWALAPINLMAVLFIVQRMESLSHTFVFAGLWLYALGRERQLAGKPGWRPILLGLGAGTLIGAMAKESAVLLPLYAFCIEFCLFHCQRQDGRRDRRLAGMYFIGLLLPALVGGGWLLERSLQPGAFASRDFTLAERLLTEPRAVVDYLHWTLLPNINSLGLYHDDYVVSRDFWQPAGTLPAMLVLAALALLAVTLRKRRPLFALGVLWFFAAQLLTATFLPLELMFEHRNYFASLGLMLALTDFLLLFPRPEWRRIGWVTIGLLMVWYGACTSIRSSEWSNPLRFALNEVSNHPLSPRATYHLAQSYVIASGGKSNSPFTTAAFEAFERARDVPNGNILPAQGLLLLASRTGRPLRREWWLEIDERLRNRPIGPQERSAMAALTECAVNQKCHFPAADMSGMFAAALSRGNDPEVINIYANYALNVLDRPQLALGLWKIAVELNPREAVYRSSEIKLLIAMGRYDEAEEQVAVLRKMGRMGQFDRVADDLQARLKGARR